MKAPRNMAAHCCTSFTFQFDPTVVQLDKSIDEGKAETGTRPLPSPTLRRKPVKYVGFHFIGDARTVVSNRHLHVIARDGSAKRDRSAARRIFEGIRKEIE